MSVTTVDKSLGRLGLDPHRLCYVPDRRIRTQSAAISALRVVEWIRTGAGLEVEPDEKALFVALHTCAHRAAQQARRTHVSEVERTQWNVGWRMIRAYLAEKNLGLAYSMVGRFSAQNTDEDDLLSDALYTLMRAMERFNPWKGFRFSTYACNAIARELMRRNNRESRHRKRFLIQHEATFDRPAREPDFGTALRVERLNAILEKNLGELTELESMVLRGRFRGDRKSRFTLQEIGDAVGLSKERVRQIQNSALSKLRNAMKQDPILQ